MFSFIYRGVDGSTWNLDGPNAGAEGAFITGVEGLVGAMSHSTTPGAGRVGVVRTGKPLVEAMDGALSVVVARRASREVHDLPSIVRKFRRAWSTGEAGELMMMSSHGRLLRTMVRLGEDMPAPEESPFDPTVAWLTFDLSVVADAGVWEGPVETVSGEGVLVRNDGDLAGWPVAEWSGSGATITGPGVAPVDLPDTDTTARIHTDPASGTLITVDGEPAPALWSQLRGRSFPVGVPPRGSAVWSFSPGVTATLTPRVLDPWGW